MDSSAVPGRRCGAMAPRHRRRRNGTVTFNGLPGSDSAEAAAFVAFRRAHDDLRVVGGDAGPGGFTLLALLRNEMYFLPPFLAHYRALGVERFVFLDDRSSDGSREYALRQPDTIVVESARRYGDPVPLPSSLAGSNRDPRMEVLWRSLLHDRFAPDRWAVQVDLDEFVHLPAGSTFPGVVSRIGRNARVLWGVMLDVYPENLSTLANHSASGVLETGATWFFDGERHLRLVRGRPPVRVYPGARARLYARYGLIEQSDRINRRVEQSASSCAFVRWRARWNPAEIYNNIRKPVLVRWGEGSYFRSSHATNLPASTRHLLPIVHFRFSGAVDARVGAALRERSHYLGSSDYRRVHALLRAMADSDGSFLYPRSRPLEDFRDLARTGNAAGL